MGSYSSIENNTNYYQNYTESSLSKDVIISDVHNEVSITKDIHEYRNSPREDKHLYKNHIKNINEILNPPAGTPQQ